MPNPCKKQIIFVSQSPDIAEHLDRHFSALGFLTTVLPVYQWLSQPQQHSSSLVLFLLSDETFTEQLIKHFEQHSYPRIAVLNIPPMKWNNKLIQHFDEFIGWPCHEKELLLRVDRLCSLKDDVEPGIDHAELIEEFLDLNMVGQSTAFIAALKLVKKISRFDASTLILGETGTGKEIAARAIHYTGGRRDAPFIPVNCGAIPDELVENELFGHEKGAFTDANATRPGVVELANGGTLFLDEVDALSPKAQVTLLRLIQEREYRPLGSKTFKKADVRIIAATNIDLQQAISDGRFREDLLFRLNVLSLTMPPLRQRRTDIELLSNHMLSRLSHQYHSHPKRLHPETLAKMKSYAWPGNVRELENLLHREFLLAEEPLLKFDIGNKVTRERRRSTFDRRAASLLNSSFCSAKAQAIANFERNYLHQLLEATEGNVSEAARRSGKERRALGRLIKKYEIDLQRFKPISA